MRLVLTSLLLLSALLISSCAGYRFGGKKPEHLSGIHSIHVPLAKSRTLFPRVEPFTTNSMVDALVRDGTYRIGTASKSDATLLVTVDELSYRQARSSENDSLRSEELRLEVKLSYELRDAGNRVIDSGKGRGHTRLFVDDNVQTAKANALNDALERATRAITARLADGI